ncbi:MAG: sulfite--cytochrome C oxidoreductase subunit B [Rhodospirillales bacterium]|nr:sulfite--cytochrome C oxidoreductase subunit B [Rhodospirillales bacterium]
MSKPLAVIALAAALGGGVAFAATVPAFHSPRVALPYPGPHFSGQGAALLNASCSTCHSADFVNGQPHLPLATWKVEVLKMKNVFHAPVEAKDVDQLAQILFARHPAPK